MTVGRRKLEGARAIITGASSGIGRELARQLAAAGASLILTARRQERLEQLAAEIRDMGGAVWISPGDITDSALRDGLLQLARDELGGLDLLINNAGVGAFGPFRKASPERLRQIMEVNFFAPVELTRTALPLLREGRRPMIVNVSSVLGHRAVPQKSEYCASKFALHGFSDSLRAELVNDRIDVLLVSPSTTDSEFFENVLEKKANPAWARTGRMSTAAVARQTVRAIRRGRHEVILSPGGKALVWFDRLMPPVINRLVARLA